jgi:transglutaminase superfamily protein
MGGRFARFLRLSPSDKRLLARATLALLAARLAAIVIKLARRKMPLASARSIIRLSQKNFLPFESAPSADRVVWAVKAAARIVPTCGNCLVQALAAEAVLIRAGHSCELRIGVVKPGDEFLAHAWLESEGRILIGESDVGFQPLVPHGRSASSPN